VERTLEGRRGFLRRLAAALAAARTRCIRHLKRRGSRPSR
jgi:hypothetical protein